MSGGNPHMKKVGQLTFGEGLGDEGISSSLTLFLHENGTYFLAVFEHVADEDIILPVPGVEKLMRLAMDNENLFRQIEGAKVLATEDAQENAVAPGRAEPGRGDGLSLFTVVTTDGDQKKP